jgi:predicted esterase
MMASLSVVACGDDDRASDTNDPTVPSALDTRPYDSTPQEPEATATGTTPTAPAPTASVPATTAPSEVNTTAPLTTTTSTVDEWDQYYPIEYAPGFRLRVTEPAPCDAVLRPAIVSANSYISGDLVERGFVVVDVRSDGPGSRTFDAQFLQAISDVSARLGIAVQWLRAHANEFCVAPDAIAVSGYSYGALAALALAYSDGEHEAGELVAVDLLGPPVVSETRLIAPPAELAGFSNDPNAVVSHAGFALADDIDTGEPPLLMFHGRNDLTVPFALAEQTCTAALAVDVVCEMIAHDQGHAFAEDNQEAVDFVADFLARVMVIPAGLSIGT